MAIKSRISSFLNKRTGIIPVLFSLMCLCLLASLAGVEIRSLDNLERHLAFNTGGEIAAIFTGVMLTISILPNYKRQSGYIRVFVTLIAFLCFTMTFDLGEALIDGLPQFRWLNITFPTLVWVSETITVFFFWLYATYALRNEGKIFQVLYIIAGFILLAFTLIPIISAIAGNPLYFYIDENSFYHRKEFLWWISRIPHSFFIVATIISLVVSKENTKKKIVISIFGALPILAMGSGGYKTGVAIQYIAMMMSIVLIFAFIFSAHEQDLYSTNKELGLATNIQKHMLPSIFPAFPERKEFDIFASMTPAKEVGGDFYDFFLIDEDHLGMVIADVSDKGVPAALFMMASKIMVQNYAMMGKEPSQVLQSVNNQICSNNQNEMFVTVWIGILDLKTGLLTCSNAGHEKPCIMQPNGKFEAYKDSHGFVVGWYPGTKYPQYKIQLEKGAKIFLYTDGVPEASSNGEQFTRERMVSTLNKYRSLTPQEIITNVKDDIDLFVGKSDQFDDITMLCVEFKGYEK